MKKIIKDIFLILNAQERQQLWMLAFADVCISLLDIIFLVALLYVISFYTQSLPATAVHLPILLKSNPIAGIIIFFILFSAKNTLAFLLSTRQYRFVYNVASRISGQHIQRYLQGSYQDYVNIDSAVVNRKISQQPIEFCHYVLNGVQQLFSQAALVMITIAAICLLNPLLFPLLVLILAPPIALTAFLMKRKLNAARGYGKQTSEKSMQHLQEALSGFVESNVYRKNDFFIRRYHRLQTQLNRYLSERLIVQNMPPRLIEVFAVFGLLALVVLHFFIARQPAIQLVTIGALAVAAYKIIPGIVKITNTIGQVKTYAFAAADLAGKTRQNAHGETRDEKLHSVEFKNVCFNYPGKQLLQSFSFNMRAGDFVIVSGTSGKGKTSFVNLLLGFLNPLSGSICINGEPADADTRQRHWANIAYVKQQPFFIHASILENITLQEKDFDTDKINDVIARAGLDTLLASVPKGLDTVITENGKNLSGGQRQRIQFARALYKTADLLVLDEPFNELDQAAEMQMLSELSQMAASGKMILLITHNPMAQSFGNKKIMLNGC